MKILFLMLPFAFILTYCTRPDKNSMTKSSDPIQIAMDKYAEVLLSDPKINATSIGIYKGGRKYTAHYGELDKGKGNRPTDETIYEIGSVSKTLTGILVANAVLEGKIKLEADIRDYLKEDYPNFEWQGKPITIRHMLTHTSRMPRFLPESINEQFTEINESLPFRIAEIQLKYNKAQFFADLHEVILDTVPGVNYAYSNVDTDLMAKILENVYGKPFDDLLTDYLSNAADMPNTRVNVLMKRVKDLANGYGETGKIVPHVITMFGADGGVKSTLPDLVNYMELQFDSENKTVVESHRSLFENNYGEIAYYIPIRRNEEHGLFYTMHGGTFGTQNWFYILPKYDLGISVITNQSDMETAGKLLRTVEGLISDLK